MAFRSSTHLRRTWGPGINSGRLFRPRGAFLVRISLSLPPFLSLFLRSLGASLSRSLSNSSPPLFSVSSRATSLFRERKSMPRWRDRRRMISIIVHLASDSCRMITTGRFQSIGSFSVINLFSSPSSRFFANKILIWLHKWIIARLRHVKIYPHFDIPEKKRGCCLYAVTLSSINLYPSYKVIVHCVVCVHLGETNRGSIYQPLLGRAPGLIIRVLELSLFSFPRERYNPRFNPRQNRVLTYNTANWWRGSFIVRNSRISREKRSGVSRNLKLTIRFWVTSGTKIENSHKRRYVLNRCN